MKTKGEKYFVCVGGYETEGKPLGQLNCHLCPS